MLHAIESGLQKTCPGAASAGPYNTRTAHWFHSDHNAVAFSAQIPSSDGLYCESLRQRSAADKGSNDQVEQGLGHHTSARCRLWDNGGGGIAVHTFFEPYGNPVGIFGTYGRAFGVNWVWAVGLTIFHSIYSISLPILLAGLLFPEVSRKQWLDRGLIGIAMAVYLGFILMFYSFAPYKPDTLNLVLFLGIVILLVVTAYIVPKDILKPSTGTPKGKAVVLSISAALFFASWVAVGVAAPQNSIPPAVSIVFIIAVSLISARLILSRVGDHENEMSKLAVVTGLMSALFLWDILMEFTAVPGILFVTCAFIYFLWRLRNSLALRSVVTRSIDLQVL